ncbi:hypothetical protein MIMGU_mgv1a019810mg [Erythranthe guttata]|uniref:J domain-containing protein n=1 Tax=Erythranthe guttata TaxID=4155 RepID=A0A022Q630_ERYGU|nr:hypothetical protein MIMGU_mgv1a019810mg [Erythranthe guttata]
MDCNKDEAVKAKEIAVKKFTEKDFRGAKKFALKAQKMFPDLEGVSHLLAVIDVYLACEKTINGEYDYYGIFGVDRFVDVQTLRNRYKKMALALHPDKNKSIGAVEAFKIISEAWEVLSGTYTRSAYDLKLNNVGSSSQTTKPQNVPTQPHIPESTTRPHVRWAASGPTSGPTRPQTQGIKAITTWQRCIYSYLRTFVLRTSIRYDCLFIMYIEASFINLDLYLIIYPCSKNRFLDVTVSVLSNVSALSINFLWFCLCFLENYAN